MARGSVRACGDPTENVDRFGEVLALQQAAMKNTRPEEAKYGVKNELSSIFGHQDGLGFVPKLRTDVGERRMAFS